jgi:hypothetical protein
MNHTAKHSARNKEKTQRQQRGSERSRLFRGPNQMVDLHLPLTSYDSMRKVPKLESIIMSSGVSINIWQNQTFRKGFC